MNHSESPCRGNAIESGHSRRSGAFSPVCATGRFSEDFENPLSHRYEDKRVSAARFPALRDSWEDHVVPMTKAGPRRTALSNKRFTAKMSLMDLLVHPDPRHFNSGTEPHATVSITSLDADCHPGPHGGRCGRPGASPDQRGPGNGQDRG